MQFAGVKSAPGVGTASIGGGVPAGDERTRSEWRSGAGEVGERSCKAIDRPQRRPRRAVVQNEAHPAHHHGAHASAPHGEHGHQRPSRTAAAPPYSVPGCEVK